MKKLTLLLLFCLSFSSFAQNAAAYKSKAEAFFDKGEFEKAIANLTLALKLNPKDDKAIAKRAACYEMINKLDLALKDNLELLKYDKSGEVYGSIGYDYLWLEKYDDARTYLKEAIALVPDNVRYRYNFALSYQIQKNYEQAINFYDEALKVSPDHKSTKVSKARCLIFSNQNEKATALIDTFFANKFFDPEMLVLRADLNKENNKLSEAFQDYGRALAVLPEDTEILNKYLKCLHALNFHEEEIDVRKREIDVLLKLKDSDSDIANSYALLAIAQEESEYLDAALVSYDESIKLDPKGGGSGGIYYLRSILKAKLKNFDGACRDLEKAKELDPGKDEELDQFFLDDEAYADFVEYCFPGV
jgi:tetratricopeptide (TPR) repeat protein